MMENTQFKIFLGLELQKNAGTTLNQEITKLTKNGINLKVGLDENSLKQLTSAINGVTQQLQKMSGLGKTVQREIGKTFDEPTKKAQNYAEGLRQLTEQYKQGTLSAREYNNEMLKRMTSSKTGELNKYNNQLSKEELQGYLNLLGQIQGRLGELKPIGNLVSTRDTSVVLGGFTEIVKRVETYSDKMGKVQTITSLVNKETGGLIASYQTLTTNQEKGVKAVENQKASLERLKNTVDKISGTTIDFVRGGKTTSADNDMINNANQIKKEYQEIMSLSQQGVVIEDSRIARLKTLIAQQQSLISIKERELSKDKSLEESLYNRDRITKQMKTLVSSSNNNYSTGVNDKESQEIEKLIEKYSKLDVAKNNMKIKTQELKDAVTSYVNSVKTTATEEQKQFVATEKHAMSVEKLKNAFKNTNTKYSIGVDVGKSNGMQDQIRAFEQLDPLAKDYALNLQQIAMNLSQYTVATRENANTVNAQYSNLAKLKTLQESLKNTVSSTKGFYDQDKANSLQQTLNQMTQMIASGQDVSKILQVLGADIKKFGKDSTSAMKESAKNLKEEQQLYSYKEKMLVNLNLLEQKFASKNMDVSKIQQARTQVQSLTVGTDNLKGKVVELDVAYKQLSGAYQMTKIGTSMKSILGMATGFYGLYSVFGYLRQAMSSMVSETTALDDAMIGLNRVTDETASTYDRFKQSALDTANEIGGTAKEIVDSASEFAKLGYQFNEATSLATSATKYATVGEISLQESTDALSASYTVFGNTIDETMGKVVDSTAIIDLYNKIGNTMAVTSGDIGEAMKASANSLSVANNSLSESVALIATANKTVQDASKVGNALRTISMRIRGVKDDAGELVPKMREIVETATNGKVDIMDGDNFKSTYQVMLEISQVWDELSDKQQAYLAETVAGKNRAEVFTAIMGNAEDLTYAMEMAEDSIGSVDEEMAIVMQSFEKRVEVMKNAWTSLANTTLSSDVAKGFVDGVTAVIQFTDACGGLVPVLAGVITSLVTLKALQSGLTFSEMKSGIKLFIKELITLKTVTNEAGKSMMVFNAVQKASIIGAITVAVMGLSYVIHQVATASQRAEERVASLREEVSAISSNIPTIQSLGEEFEKLSKKPNLTKEESEKLFDVQNRIKEIQPEIGGYYDEQGNFIITQVSTAQELLAIQKEILKTKREEAFEASKDSIDKKLESYEKQKKALKDLAEEQAKAQRIENGTSSIWDNLTYTSDASKAIMKQTNGAYVSDTTIKTAEEKVKESRDKIEEYSKDIHDFLINAMVIDESWDSLGEKSANAIRKTLSEMDDDKIAEFARQIQNGDLKVADFIQKMKETASVTNEVKTSIESTSQSTSGMEEPISSLSVLAEQVAENMDILKVSLNELDATNDISEETMKKLISKYPELAEKIKGVESAYLALNQKMAEQEFDDASDKIADLTGILEDLEAGNGLTASSFKKLSSSFPELLAYMSDEATLSDQIKGKMESLKQAQKDAYSKMLMNSQEYYKQNILGNEQMVNSISNGITDLFKGLGTAYQGDLKNWKNLAQGKADIEEQLIKGLNTAWESHFGTLMTKFNSMPNSVVATPMFDEESFKADLKSKFPVMAMDKNWMDSQIKFAQEQFKNQTSEYQKYQAEVAKKNQELANLFDIKFDMPDIKLGGSKTSPSSSSSSSAKASYVASIFQEIVDEILRGGEEIEKAMDEANTKLDNAVLVGDEALQEQLTAKIANLQVALRDKQSSMAKELETQMSQMAKILSDSGAFKGYDLSKLTEKDMAQVIQNIDKQINSATLAQNDSEVDRLNDLKSLINDIGSVYLDTIEKRRDLSDKWWQEENARLEKFAENLDKQYQKKFDALDREDKILELRKSMLLEDGGQYDKEQKEADKIFDINAKLLANLLKKRALCESQIAQLRAKGFKEESEEIQTLQDKWLDYEQSRLDMIKEIAEARRQNAIDSAQNELDDVSNSKDYIKDLLSLTMDMLKEETDAKKEALKEQVDARKEALKEEYEAEKKALEDKLSLLQKEANARKDALTEEKEEKDYQENVAEKQKEISNIQQKIDSLSQDDSITSQKLKKELQAELESLIKELEKIQYERSLELQQQAIDKELEKQEEKIEAELESLEDQYDKEVEMIEDKYDAQLKEYEDYLNNQTKLKEEASKLIESRDKEFYERLKKYAIEYTDTTQAEFEDCWNKAYEALDKYGNKQLGVIGVIEQMTQRVIALNAELKKLNDSTYKDFIQDDSSTSSDDFEFAGDNNNSSSSSDKKVDEERDRIAQQMNENSAKWFSASDEEKKRLAEENRKLASQIGAWQANQDGNGYKKGDWLVMINKKIVPVKNAVGVRHTGLETGEVGAPFGKFKLKSNEELNKLENGEIVLNGDQTRNIMDNVKRVYNGSQGNEVSIVVDMHDFSVAKDTFEEFKKLMKVEVPKIINQRLINKGIK